MDRLHPGCNKCCAFQTGKSAIGNGPGVVMLLVILVPELSLSVCVLLLFSLHSSGLFPTAGTCTDPLSLS